MKSRSKLIKYILPIVILAVGLAGMSGMVLSKTAPEKTVPDPIGTLVETLVLKAEDHQIKIHATGTVQPAVEVTIVPQVGGRVVRLAEGFQEGRFFDKGQLLFEIESADYQLAVEKSRAEIAKAEYDLATVNSQARVARLEWERVNLDQQAKPNPLVLYEPQLKNAQAALAGAKADLQQKLLDLERTRIHAPFNCRISSKSVDLGQFVTAGQAVATVAGTDAAEIVIPVPLHELQWIDVPQSNRQVSSTATVHLSAGMKHSWSGRIDRSLGEADAQSRMIRLVVKVDDPYGLKEKGSHALDLAEGLFVAVTLQGKILQDVFAVPVSALRHDDTLWLRTADGTLDILKVQVLRREKENVLVHGEMHTGQALVTTHVSGAAQGMRLRLARGVQS